MATVKVTKKGNWVFIDGMPKPLPLTDQLRIIFAEKEVEWFEATVNNGRVILLKTVPAP